jgi:hypothetical protein
MMAAESATALWQLAQPICRTTGAIAAIYHEEIRRHLSADSAHVHGGLSRNSDRLVRASAHSVPSVPVGTTKRFIAGTGAADKQAVIAAIRARGFAPADDNEADAIAILLWAIETNGGVK